MSTNIEQGRAAAATSATSSGTKISFAVKKGFVIPKNKLSGSLVPTFRGGKKGGASDVVDEESNKPVQRKTKWGPDLTQDVSVRKVRALAYQTRVDQITEQLKSGFLDTEFNQDSSLAVQNPNLESTFHQKSELLELERREAIGEILKLNPSYKAPSDYKPLLKEAKVPVPTKEHPGYNFLGMLFGPSSDTLKQLEKEMGAKVRVYGTKANTKEKAEITSSDANEAHGTYEELYVHIYADNYEKVDAAVALIELLVKPVLVNETSGSMMPTPASADDVKITDQTQGTSAPNTISPIGVNPEFQQPISAPAPIPPPLFPYSAPWFSPVPPQPPNIPNIPNTPSFFDPRPVSQQHPFLPQGQFGRSPSHPQPSSTGFSPVAGPPAPSMGPPLGPPRGPQPISQQPIPSGPNAFTNMRMSSFAPNQSAPQMQRAMVRPATPSPPPLAPPYSATSAPQPPPFQPRTPNSFPGNVPPIQPQRPPNDNFTFQPQRPQNDNFTFQPQRPQNHLSQANSRPIMQNNMMTQNQPFRPPVHNPSPQEILEAILRPLLSQNLNQIRNQFPPLPENSNFVPQGGPRNNLFPVQPSFRGAHVGLGDLGNPFPPRQGTSLHPQRNFPPPNRPQNFFNQNKRGRDMSSSIRPNIGHGAHQVYDPFSPSDVSDVPPRGG